MHPKPDSNEDSSTSRYLSKLIMQHTLLSDHVLQPHSLNTVFPDIVSDWHFWDKATPEYDDDRYLIMMSEEILK
jgi:hypothetical protein